MNDLIEALQILAKYGTPEYPTACEHDILMLSPDIDPQKVSDEDKQKLEELGFSLGDPFGYGDNMFYSYKFGSC